MHEEIIQLLELPRKLVHGELELENCPHAGNFDQLDHQCTDCHQGPECKWLCDNDEYASLDRHSEVELMHALDFAIVYVHGALIKWNHQPETCICNICQWHRKAQSAYDVLATDDRN